MKKNMLVFIFIIVNLINSVCVTADSHRLYIGEKGNDQNSGTKDSPLARIDVALEKVRTLKKNNTENLVEIHLLPGTYYLDTPLKIGPELSHLSISGGGKILIKGSKKLKLRWKKHTQQIWQSEIQENLAFDQLVVNGELQILARYPNYDEEGGHWQGHAADAISPARIKTWKNPSGAYVHIMHKGEWGDFHYQIVGVDDNGEAILKGGHQNNRPENGLNDRYRMVENVFEELDSPGEWFFDSENRKLYFWPPEGLDLKKALIEIPVLKHLIEIKGSMAEPVKDIRIQGIRFEHTARTFMEDYDKLLRSDWCMYRGGSLLIEGAENCEIRDCQFANLGGNVIFVNRYNRDITISGNHIYECGATAISFVGDTSAVRSPSFWYYDFVPYDEMDKEIGAKK